MEMCYSKTKIRIEERTEESEMEERVEWEMKQRAQRNEHKFQCLWIFICRPSTVFILFILLRGFISSYSKFLDDRMCFAQTWF